MNPPFVSIIVAVYNGEKIIGACLESLIFQDYPQDRTEIIVVDNKSSDRTAAVVHRYPVRYVREERIQGSYAARNTGAAQAKGEALLFFDADQVVEPDFLKKFMGAWEDKLFSAFGAPYKPIGDRNTLAGKYWHEQEDVVYSNTNRNHPFPKLGGGNLLIRREVFEALGGFDSSFISWGDCDFSYRLFLAKYSVKFILDAVIGHKERNTIKSLLSREYRIGFGRSSFDRKHRLYRESIIKVLRRALGRTLIGIPALLVGMVRPLNGRSRSEHLGLILLDTAMRWAYFGGRMHYLFRWNNGRLPAKW